MTNNRYLLPLILGTIVSGLSGIAGNIATNQLPVNWKSHLWLAWPVFVVLLLVTVIVAIWQRLLENGDTRDRPMSPTPSPSLSDQQDEQFDAFISYSHKDKAVVTILVDRLRTDGFRLWIDEEQIGGGDPLRKAMVDGILHSQHIIVCLSPAYLDSEWGTFESAVNQTLDPDNRQRRLIPVKIAPVTVPPEYGYLYCPDLTNPAIWEQEYLKTIKHLLPRAQQEDPLEHELAAIHESSPQFELIARTVTSATPSPWLQNFGFQYDPFAFFEAEKMPPEILEETFVDHPGFNQYILDLERSAVLVASRGSGKTAGRLRLTTVLNRYQRHDFANTSSQDSSTYMSLVVTYSNFQKIVELLPNVTLEDHTEPLLEATAKSVYDLIRANPVRFMALSPRARDWWWALLATYLKGVPLNYLDEEPLASDWQRDTTRSAPFQPDSTLTNNLEDLRERLVDLGFNRLFVLIDGVDGYSQTRSRPNLEALVTPLLNTLPLLSLEETIWKFFLPDFLEETILRSNGYQTGRLNLVSIIWNEPALIKLLRSRLVWASDGLIREMAQLCEEQLLREVDVDQKLVRMALLHNRFGPPRMLLYLGSQLLQKPEKGKRISKEDWNEFDNQFQRCLS